MRKTLNINLGGIAFIIDENAFDLLHNYLEALKRKFKNEAEREEIMADIESRIAEMLGKKLAGGKEVLSVADVQPVIDMMGKPEDIAGDESTDAPGESSPNYTGTTTTNNNVKGTPVKKRLFRDPDDAKVGGVISGLCHYFGINDPVWIRIAALCLIPITGGAIIPLYLLLIVVVPKAYTAADKLQMKGEPININTIEKEIKDAANRAGQSVNDLFRNNTFFERLLDVFGKIALVFLKIIAGFFIFVGLFVLVILAAVLTGVSLGGNEFIKQAPHFVIDDPQSVLLYKIGLALSVGIPVIALLYAALRLLIGSKARSSMFKWVLLVLWLIGLALMAITGARTFTQFRTDGVKKESYTLMQSASNNLYVQLVDSAGNKASKENDGESFVVDWSGVYINGEDLKNIQLVNIGRASLELTTSDNGSFTLEKYVSANGRTKSEAISNAEKTVYNFTQTDSLLNLPADAFLDKNNKWRRQRVKVVIGIPEGKTIHFANNIDRWAATVVDDDNYNDTYFSNTTWTVVKGKVKCISGENHFNAKTQAAADEETDKKIKHTDKSDQEDTDDDKSSSDKKKGDF